MHFGRSSPLPARACQAWRNRAGAHLRRPNPSRARARSILPPPGPGFFPCWRTPPTRLDAPPPARPQRRGAAGSPARLPSPRVPGRCCRGWGSAPGTREATPPAPMGPGLGQAGARKGLPPRGAGREPPPRGLGPRPAPVPGAGRGHLGRQTPPALPGPSRLAPPGPRAGHPPAGGLPWVLGGGPSRNRPRATLRSRPSSASARSSPSCAAAGPGLRRLEGAQGGPLSSSRPPQPKRTRPGRGFFGFQAGTSGPSTGPGVFYHG